MPGRASGHEGKRAGGQFLLSSSLTSAGNTLDGSGSPAGTIAVAFVAATSDIPREITAGQAAALGGRAGSGLEPIRVNPMILFTPDVISE